MLRGDIPCKINEELAFATCIAFVSVKLFVHLSMTTKVVCNRSLKSLEEGDEHNSHM